MDAFTALGEELAATLVIGGTLVYGAARVFGLAWQWKQLSSWRTRKRCASGNGNTNPLEQYPDAFYFKVNILGPHNTPFARKTKKLPIGAAI